MNDDWLLFAEDIGRGIVIGVLLCLVIFGPAMWLGRW